MLLDFQKSQSAKGVPPLEEKCVRAIVGGALDRYRSCRNPEKSAESTNDDDESNGNSNSNEKMTAEAALESARRSLKRVHDLLERLTASLNDPWVFETMAYFQASIGQDEKVHDNLMKEYRSLQSVHGWEKDDSQVEKVCNVVTHIVRLSQNGGANGDKQNKQNLSKSKFLLSGVIQRIKKSRLDDPTKFPESLKKVEGLLNEVSTQLDDIA